MSSRIVDRRSVARRFREEPHGRRMVLVALGPLSSPSDASHPEDGFDLHLVEPVDTEYLARLITDGAIGARGGPVSIKAFSS